MFTDRYPIWSAIMAEDEIMVSGNLMAGADLAELRRRIEQGIVGVANGRHVHSTEWSETEWSGATIGGHRSLTLTARVLLDEQREEVRWDGTPSPALIRALRRRHKEYHHPPDLAAPLLAALGPIVDAHPGIVFEAIGNGRWIGAKGTVASRDEARAIHEALSAHCSAPPYMTTPTIADEADGEGRYAFQTSVAIMPPGTEG